MQILNWKRDCLEIIRNIKELGFMPGSFLYAKERPKKYSLHAHPTSIIIIDV